MLSIWDLWWFLFPLGLLHQVTVCGFMIFSFSVCPAPLLRRSHCVEQISPLSGLTFPTPLLPLTPLLPFPLLLPILLTFLLLSSSYLFPFLSHLSSPTLSSFPLLPPPPPFFPLFTPHPFRHPMPNLITKNSDSNESVCYSFSSLAEQHRVIT